jgi:hypothetical protein
VLPADLALPDTSHDLAAVTRLILDAAIPDFADAAGVFVLEHLLSGGAPASQANSGQVVARRLGARFTPAAQRAAGAALPAGEVLVFGEHSPYARCVHGNATVAFGQPDGMTLERVRPDARKALARYASFLAAPMAVNGAAIGLLVLARAVGAPAFGEADAAAAGGLAVRAGSGIDAALALIRQRLTADPLASPGPAAIRHPLPGLEIAGRCLPAAGYDSGGDWYDIIPLPSGRTGLIVGDVMGHGTQATVVMAQLRAAAYVLADLDLPPAEVLRQLNRATVALPHGALATCAYAAIDPGGHACTLATAGHLPPVLTLPGGTTRVPDLPSGQSLGVGPASYGQARIKLPPGAILALYTDGLVETRTRPFEEGITALRSALGSSRQHLGATCDELIRTLADPREDDVTLVLARIPYGSGGQRRTDLVPGCGWHKVAK